MVGKINEVWILVIPSPPPASHDLIYACVEVKVLSDLAMFTKHPNLDAGDNKVHYEIKAMLVSSIFPFVVGTFTLTDIASNYFMT